MDSCFRVGMRGVIMMVTVARGNVLRRSSGRRTSQGETRSSFRGRVMVPHFQATDSSINKHPWRDAQLQ